jgi:[acyl-carrier-protein] S-malonyltransferase
MGRTLIDVSPAAADVFAEADDALAEPITPLCYDGPEEVLNLTINAQPAILAASMAYLAALEERAGTIIPAFYAGHSMGQYSAMVAAGVLSLEDGMRLVRERGVQMQASAEGGAMAAVIGLPEDQIGALVRAGEAVGSFTVANRNSPGQIVVSGERAAVEKASEVARELGAKRAIVLPVSVAAHSSLMSTAAEQMRRILAGIEFSDPLAPLLANADARLLTTGDECRNELVEHLTRGVDWVTAVESMIAAGVSQFVEIGPGKVLTGLVKRIAPDAEALATDDQSAEGRLAIPPFLTASPAGATS